jgi:tyrosyl-tRNA synthetase
LLTDVQVADIEKMKTATHPMAAKKDLARRIVADFHSAEAATKAGEDWAKQFQKDEVPDSVEEVLLTLAELGGVISNTKPGFAATVRTDKVLVKCGLAASVTDAARKIKQGAVRINDQVHREPHFTQTFSSRTDLRLNVKVGRQMRIAVISW